MDLVTGLTRERGMASVLITHDLGLAATYCDRIASASAITTRWHMPPDNSNG
jgi:ABC-type dipeptide/oligopeptide/nickel transport system ATPase component